MNFDPTSHARGAPSTLFTRDMLTRQRLHEQIAMRIEQMIADGQLKVGDRLPSETEMAETFGVNRSTVREALSVLQKQGLLEMKVGSGSYVSQVSPTVVAETFDSFFVSNESSYEDLAVLRTLLEPGIAALAARRAGPEDIERMERALGAFEAAAGAGDTDAEIAADAEFHLALAAASQNRLLFAVFNSIHYVFRRALRSHRDQFPARRDSLEVLHNHQALLAAVRAGVPTQARELMNVQMRSLFETDESSMSLVDDLLCDSSSKAGKADTEAGP